MNNDPVARRMYLAHKLAEAQNPCELIACQVAIRVLEDDFPFLKNTTYDKPEIDDTLTPIAF